MEVENKNTWKWFIKVLRDDLELVDGFSLVIVTDMQKVYSHWGLLNSLTLLLSFHINICSFNIVYLYV